jgi:hypothetical protein
VNDKEVPIPDGVKNTLKPLPDGLVHSPRVCAVLRPVREPLTDYLIIPAGGLERYPNTVSLFSNCHQFPDGSEKKYIVHTNMIQDGQLGNPTLFDLYFLDFHIVKHENAKDIMTVMQTLRAELLFGGNTVFLSFSASDMKPYIFQEYNEKDPDQKARKEFLYNELAKYAECGVWPWYRIDARGIDKRARRIESTESFRLEVRQLPLEKPMSGDVNIKVMMTGMKYKAI